VVGVLTLGWKVKANVELVRKAMELADKCGKFSIRHGHFEAAHKLALTADVIVERPVGAKPADWLL